MLIEHLFELDEKVFRWDNVSPCALNRLNVKRRVLASVGFRVPDAVVFALKQAGKFLYTLVAVLFLAHPLGAAEVIGIFDELRAIAKMPVAPSVTITGSNR